jgi:hypothetical protein
MWNAELQCDSLYRAAARKRSHGRNQPEERSIEQYLTIAVTFIRELDTNATDFSSQKWSVIDIVNDTSDHQMKANFPNTANYPTPIPQIHGYTLKRIHSEELERDIQGSVTYTTFRFTYIFERNNFNATID